MPDPIQKKHADKIAFERNLMEVTGLTRSQVRQNLATFAQRRLQAVNEPRVVETKPAPEVKDISQSFAPQPFRLDGNGTGGGGSSLGGNTADPGVLLEDIIVVLNGTAYYTNIYTDGRLDAV